MNEEHTEIKVIFNQITYLMLNCVCMCVCVCVVLVVVVVVDKLRKVQVY